MIAKFDESICDYISAIKHYSRCAKEFEEKCLYIITKEKLFDIGLKYYPEGSEIWNKIITQQLEYLIKSNRPQKEIAMTAIKSNNEEIILNNIKSIVKYNDLWQLILPIISVESYEIIKNALLEDKQYENAAYFTLVYLKDPNESKNLYIKAHKWMKAIECGASKEEVALEAYNLLMKDINKKINAVQNLKKRFNEVQEKQKLHPESSIRHGAQKNKKSNKYAPF